MYVCLALIFEIGLMFAQLAISSAHRAHAHLVGCDFSEMESTTEYYLVYPIDSINRGIQLCAPTMRCLKLRGMKI